MEGTSKLSCDEKQEVMECDRKEKNTNVVELVTKYVADWRPFGRVLGLTESYLAQLQEDYQFSHQRNAEIIKKFSYPFEPKQSWTFWREYLQKFDNGRIVVKDIEMDHINLLPETSYNIGTSKLSSDEKQEIMESVKKEININVVELIVNSVAEWRTFGRILGLRESYLALLDADYQFYNQRNFEIIKTFSYPFEPKQSWRFWREYLQQFENGKIVVKDIEMKHIDLLAEASYNIEHTCPIKDNIYIGHPYEYNSTKLLAESDIKKAIISVRLSDEKNGFTHYQEYKDWVLTQKHYIDTYNMLKDIQKINFIDEHCPILETLNTHFTKTNDPGFAVKGYNFVNEFCLFKEGVFPKHIFGDTYFSYFANENIVLYITKCTKGTSHALYHSMQNVEIANTIHKELREQNITQVNVIVHNNNSDEVFCKQCIDYDLFVKEDIFTDIEKFSSWYSKVLEKITQIQLKIKEPEKGNESAAAENDEKQTQWYNNVLKTITNKRSKMKERAIIREIKTKEEICDSVKKHIITYEALERNFLPSFSNDPEDQMEELKKLIVLSPNQFKALHSNHKHILLRGSYGSGKSLVLFKKFEEVIDKMSELDIVYLICNDQQSQFIHYMKYIVSKYSMKNVIVCNSKEITLRKIVNKRNLIDFIMTDISDKNAIPKLSYILNHIENMWKDRTVHILIDEFNGSYFNENEIKKLKSILVKFQNSHIFIALQSMEQTVDEADNDVGYKFDLLKKATSFTCYNLDYSLRSSLEINEFVKATAEVVETSKVAFDEVQTFAGEEILVDSEQGMEHSNESSRSNEMSMLGTYKYNQIEEIGHTVSAGMVNIYHSSSNKSNGESDRYIMYLSTLVYILKELSELKKYVICTYDKYLYNVVCYYLKNEGLYNWTDKIEEFINSQPAFTILLTDYASVRGYEFINFIFLSPLGNKFLKYRMLECFARSTTELHVISDNINVTNGSIDSQIIKKWKNLKCVNFNYCSYNKSADEFYLSNGGNKIYCKENASKVFTKATDCRYRWNAKPEKGDRLESNQPDDDISIGLRCVVSADNIRLFNDFIKLHNIDIYTYRGMDPQNLLHIACENDAVFISKILINDYKIDVNSIDDIKETPLHKASYEGHINIVQLLLNKGADVKVKNKLGMTPLHIASFEGYKNIVQFLLDNGADANVKNTYGDTPLHRSSHSGQVNIAQLLLNNGADSNVKNNVDTTPLHDSSLKGYINIVRLLLNNGADVNVKNKEDNTPLHRSSYEGHVNIGKLLLDNGADVNVKNKEDNTPLHISSDEGHINVVQFLLNNRADVNVNNVCGRTAVDLAEQYNRHDIVELLKRYK